MHPLDPGYGVNMCADTCKCPQDYDPVCGQDTTFYSPCHAGCTVRELIDDKYYVSSKPSYHGYHGYQDLVQDLSDRNLSVWGSPANHGDPQRERICNVPAVMLIQVLCSNQCDLHPDLSLPLYSFSRISRLIMVLP